MSDPASFTPVGQPVAIQLIRRMIASRRVGGSYLFTGPPGVGKKTTARFFALSLNCQNEAEAPCGSCDACQKILVGNHPDFLKVSPAPGKQTISVEQVRQLQETLAYGPYEGNRRVVVIDPAERLGIEASNALLLTLEAPPSHTIFILVTSTPYALLETIRSRCQIVRLSPLSKQALIEVARHAGVEISLSEPALELCQGSVTRLLSLLETDGQDTSREIDALLTSILLGESAAGLIETPKWAKQRDTMEAFLERALWTVRDVWATLEGKCGVAAHTSGIVKKIAARLPAEAREKFPNLVEDILQAMADLKNNASPELIFTTLRLEMEELRG